MAEGCAASLTLVTRLHKKLMLVICFCQYVICQLVMSYFILVQISDVDERSALIVLSPPHFSRPDIDVDPAEFQYELFLSENRDCKFSLVYR